MNRKTKQPDIEIINGGPLSGIVEFLLNTDKAIAWCKKNLNTESWQWRGEGTCLTVDARCARELMPVFQAHGFKVQ